MRHLKSIWQQNGSVDELNTRFRLFISKAELDMVQNAVLLVQMYEDAISLRLFQTLVVNGKNSDNIEMYMANTSEVDWAFRQTSGVMKNTFQKTGKKGKKSSYTPNYWWYCTIPSNAAAVWHHITLSDRSQFLKHSNSTMAAPFSPILLMYYIYNFSSEQLYIISFSIF